MDNYYQALGVPLNATPPIVKIAYEGRLKALAKSDMPPADRVAEERLLQQAYITLSNPAKKAWYDRNLEAWEEAGRPRSRAPWIAGIAAASIALAVGWYAVDRSREQQRLRLEEQRLALEREKAARHAEIEQARLEAARESRTRSFDYRREVEERNRRERERHQVDNLWRAEENAKLMRERQAQAAAQQAQMQARMEEERQRRLDEETRRKALAEVERQKRFVQQREMEEERARVERYNKVMNEERYKDHREDRRDLIDRVAPR